MTPEQITALSASIFTGIAGVIMAAGALLKTLWDSKSLRQQISGLRGEVKELREKVDHLTRRNRALWAYIDKLLGVIRELTSQVRNMGCEPCSEPPEWVDDGQATQPLREGR